MQMWRWILCPHPGASIDLWTLGDSYDLFKSSLKTMHIKAPRNLELAHGDIIIRRFFCQYGKNWYPNSRVSFRRGHRVIHVDDYTESDICALSCEDWADSFAFVLRRVQGDPLLGHLCVGATLANVDTPSTSGRIISSDAISTLPTHHKIMAVPYDSWALEEEGLPRIYVRSQRMPLGDESSSAVDVIDLILPKYQDAVDHIKKNWNNGVWLE